MERGLMNEFLQDPPRLKNTYQSNRWLKAYLRSKLPKDVFAKIDSDLVQLGERCREEYLEIARQAEKEKPTLVQFDPWGKRIDEVRVSQAWNKLSDISAREGMIAHGYKREHGEFSRVYQF